MMHLKMMMTGKEGNLTSVVSPVLGVVPWVVRELVLETLAGSVPGVAADLVVKKRA